MSRKHVSPARVILGVSLWMAGIGNLALWRRLATLEVFAGFGGLAFGVALFTIVAAAIALLLGLFAWRATLKPAATVLLLVSAAAAYFMLAYGIVIDPGMVTNAVQTDLHEAGALASGKMALAFALLAGPPVVLLWRQPLDHGGAWRQAARSGTVVAGALALVLVASLLCFPALASLMRNHKELRYLVNPLSTVYSAARVAAATVPGTPAVLVRVGEDAHLPTRATAGGRRRIVLLVVGETARSGNFGINGYERPTTPALQRHGAWSLRDAWSCGTSTAVSLPCMFSGLPRTRQADADQREGLLDVLRHAGVPVLWIDNQSGCKGVCARVASVDLTAERRGDCGTACPDEALLKGLDARIEQLDPAHAAPAMVVVLHPMGSHGPAYHLRSPDVHKRFLPECRRANLQDCSRAEVRNAYDNSIAYTDHVLGRAIDWLRTRNDADTALLYVADHGESLGENNLYLHGMPYALAPDVQKHVPWIAWFSPGYLRGAALSTSCLRGLRDQRVSHDNYFHAVLGLVGVRTDAYQPDLDPYRPCRGAGAALALRPGLTPSS